MGDPVSLEMTEAVYQDPAYQAGRSAHAIGVPFEAAPPVGTPEWRLGWLDAEQVCRARGPRVAVLKRPHERA